MKFEMEQMFRLLIEISIPKLPENAVKSTEMYIAHRNAVNKLINQNKSMEIHVPK